MSDQYKTKIQLLEEINMLRIESNRLHKLTKDYHHEKEELRKKIRALKILSGCNQALIRAKDEKALLNNICRIIVDKGGYGFAWIGYLQNDVNKSILPAAHAGINTGYLDSINILSSKKEFDKSPVGRAIHDRKPQIIKDISSDKSYIEWKSLAEKSGFMSSITFPLLKEDSCFGALNIYSFTSNAFDGTEVVLLKELSDDLAFGISSLRTLKEKETIAKNLKENDERTRSLFENAAIGIYRTSIDGKILMANPELLKILGYDSLEDLTNTSIKNIYMEIDKRKELLDNAFKNKAVTGFETEFKRKDCSPITVRINGRLINNGSMNEQYLEGTIEDISNKKEIEKNLIAAKERAEEMNRLKDNFLANMSHELRTPMVGILGFSEIFLNILDNPNYKEMAESLYSSGKRLMETLDSILDLSKLEANKLQFSKSKVNINSQVNELISAYKETAQKRGLYLKHEIKDEDLYSNLDIQLLKKILNNLINNAIKYTDHGGVTIEVTSQNIIFEDFRQLSEGLNRKYEGNGLGLSLTKRFVELLGGEIQLESTINSGSIFTIKFPAIEIDETAGAQEKTKIIQSVQAETRYGSFFQLPYILMVDNDLTTIDIAKIMLKNTCNIEYALNGNEALKKINDKYYDAIFMDINLGAGINGMEVTKIIRSNPSYEKTPIIACTAYAMHGDKEKFMQEGCTHYISKPFNKESINNIINGIFNVQKINAK